MIESLLSDEALQALSVDNGASSANFVDLTSKELTTKSPSNALTVANSSLDNNLDGAFTKVNKEFVEEEEVYVKMRPSAFRNIPNVVFMDYPPELKIARNDFSSMEVLGARKLSYMSYWERICIRNAFTIAGFKKSTKNWTGLWSKHQNDTQMKGLNCLQKVNHFPSSWCVGRKDRLARTMQSMYRKHGNHFDFHPNSFILPSERDALHRQIQIEMKTITSMTRENSGLWIVKPCASSCGKGIQVMTGSQILALPKSKKILVQKYLADPYCIDGNKFDLRMYVLVTGVDPLRVYVHSEGLARISTSKYSLKNIGDRFAHLTNYSVNKKSKEFKRSAAMADDVNITEQYTQENKDAKKASKKKSKKANNGDFEYDDADGEDEDDNGFGENDDDDEDEEEEEEESNTSPSKNDSDPEQRKYKWSLSQFKSWLAKREGKGVMEKTMESVNDLLIKTMLAAESVITPKLHGTANYRTNCFELFGCDVMLDRKLKPHLIEVNISPSLMGGSSIDKQVKGMLMSDILHTIGLYPYDMKMMKKYEEDKKIVAGSGNAGSVLKRLATPTSSKMDKKDLVQSDTHNQQSKVNNAAVKSSPFAFASMSKMMTSQDGWRKKPHPMNINMKSLGSNDAVWNMLLMCEDEFSRSKCTQFHLVHPNPATAIHYNSLYFNARFSDQLLARWILQNGSLGELRSYIPTKYLPLGDDRVIAAEAEKHRLLNGGATKAQLMSGNLGMKKLALASPPRGSKSQKGGNYNGNSIRKRVTSARQYRSSSSMNRPEKNSDSSSSGSGNASIASSTDNNYQQYLNNNNNLMNMQPMPVEDYQDQNQMMHANVSNTFAPASQSQRNQSTYNHTKKNLTDLRHFGISGDIRLAKDSGNDVQAMMNHGANGGYPSNSHEEHLMQSSKFVENNNFATYQNQIPALPKVNKSSFLIRNTLRGQNNSNNIIEKGYPSHTPGGIAENVSSNINAEGGEGSELDLKAYARSGLSFDEYRMARARGGSSHVQNIMAQRELQLQATAHAMLMARDEASANNDQTAERTMSSNVSYSNQEQGNESNYESSSVRQVHRKTLAHGSQQRSRSKPVSMSRKWI